MKFFKPEDFYTFGELDTRKTPQQASDKANAKLEREGKVVYSNDVEPGWFHRAGNPHILGEQKVALLIAIEPIESPCTHPSEKVRADRNLQKLAKYVVWICECGAPVKPGKFEVME